MYLVRAARARKLQPAVAERAALHERPLDRAASRGDQLARFNELWPAIRANVPYYADLAHARRLPQQFRNWQEVVDGFPVLNRDVIKEHGARLRDSSRPPDSQRVTGGSSAQPIQMPHWDSEYAFTTPDIWMARAWYGISPADRMFLLWGHRHLLGTGWKARVKGLNRQMRDYLMGYCRWSAYDLSPEGLRAAGEALLRFRPAYVVGYSVALDMMARANADRAAEFKTLRLKAIIGTAEGFPSADSTEVVASVFGAPVAMEYGAVETTVIAYTRPARSGFDAFWNNDFLEAVEPGPNGGRILRITCLYPRCFPLIRYEIGDEIALDSGDDGLGVDHFERVIGRCNAFLVLRDGTRIHSEAITHVVSSCADVGAYQAVQEGDVIAMLLTAPKSVPATTIDLIRGRLTRIHPLLADVAVKQVDQLRQTIAGKTPMILRIPSPSGRGSG